MTITAASADALEALALAIFNPNVQPNDPAQAGLGARYDPTKFTGIKGQDSATDAQYLALVAPIMLAIDGRTMATGLEYTLNVTNASQGRPKHWYKSSDELNSVTLPLGSVALQFEPTPGGVQTSVSSYGFTEATAFCAAICFAWAAIIRMWLAGNYPLGVNQPMP